MTSPAGEARALLLELDEYRLIRPLGRRKRVYLAHDQLLDRAVVVNLLEDDAAVGGARALARVSHPHLAQVHRVRAGERPYVVSELLRGRRLDALGGAPARELLSIGRALAGALAALHGAGVAHGDVRPGRVMLGDGGPQLFGLDKAGADASPEACRQDVRALAALLRRLGATVGEADTAEELAGELELLARPAPAASDNPYRGLRPFASADGPLFFGRDAEIAQLLARLRGEPWLLLAGRSGTGKSSLARAGLAPSIAAGALGEREAWQVAAVLPGARPLAALAGALAPLVGRDAAGLEAVLRDDPAEAARVVRDLPTGVCLLVDQLEEALTIAAPEERAPFLAALAGFGMLAPGVRLLMTLRSDALGPLSELGALGRDLLRAVTLVAPMSREGLRAAVVAPARARGVELETPAMVDALVAEAHGREAGLPLLSFALAELWQARDVERKLIPASALARQGGAAAALARHGELVLAALPSEERREARRLLVLLASAAERQTRAAPEALRTGGPAAARALEALVAGRLVVAGDSYELAHEALVGAWPRLRAWVDEASDRRTAAARLRQAARDWDRQGRTSDLLLGARQVAEIDSLNALDGLGDGTVEALVAQSRASLAGARRRRIGLRLGAVATLTTFLIVSWRVAAWRERRELRADVDARLAEADRELAEARRLDAEVTQARAEAFARFDENDMANGNARWAQALALAGEESRRFAAASQAVDQGLARNPNDPAARRHAAELFQGWLRAAERDHAVELADELRSRLQRVGGREGRGEPARLTVTPSPPGARLTLHAVRRGGRYVEDAGRPLAAGAPVELPAGPYLIEAEAPGRWPTRYPLLLEEGHEERVALVLPEAAAVPPGFVYVPAGRSLFGGADGEPLRRTLAAQPEHEIVVPAFLIGEHEVTWGEYLEFLASLPPDQRDARRPHIEGLVLAFADDGTAVLTIHRQTVRAGKPFCLEARSHHRCQDWLRLPVAGVSWEDATAYTGWLSARVPGARLCREREWERAARGADGRRYPHGDLLEADDGNFAQTWKLDGDQMESVEVGTFPTDRSPFGVMDQTGNVSEWVADSVDAGRTAEHIVRGGSWILSAFSSRASNRNIRVGRTGFGLRVCASAP